MAREPKVLYEDDNIIVISKPAHLSVHANGVQREYTLADWIVSYDPSIKRVGEPLVLDSGKKTPRPGIVHRLDRETSGAMVIARHQKAYRKLKRLFKNREVEKWYHAVVYGKLNNKRYGEIGAPIARSKNDFRRRTTKRAHMRGKERSAVTHYWPVTATSEATLVRAKPETGRTHQIRVHLASINHPVVCDSLYAAHRPCLFNLKRAALHAVSLTLRMPDGSYQTFEAPYPPDFAKAVDELSQSPA
jgi:23S rRNA pseudouridine1911/1915/1917 synthase